MSSPIMVIDLRRNEKIPFNRVMHLGIAMRYVVMLMGEGFSKGRAMKYAKDNLQIDPEMMRELRSRLTLIIPSGRVRYYQ